MGQTKPAAGLKSLNRAADTLSTLLAQEVKELNERQKAARRENTPDPGMMKGLKEATAVLKDLAGVVLLWFVRTVRTGRNIIFVEFRPADTGYRDGRFPLLPAPAWRAQRGCADGGTLPAAHPCSETAYPR